LADVPCSGTGVIRRHPDIKLLRQHSDLEQFHRQQLSILKFLWPQLSPGGELLYVTCSIVKQENDQTIDTFLEQTPSAEHETIAADWGVQTSRGRQLLPSLDGADGLYFSRLKKSATHR
jgi:16S rRNA (cytosine967-C5)-methyltransferase